MVVQQHYALFHSRNLRESPEPIQTQVLSEVSDTDNPTIPFTTPFTVLTFNMRLCTVCFSCVFLSRGLKCLLRVPFYFQEWLKSFLNEKQALITCYDKVFKPNQTSQFRFGKTCCSPPWDIVNGKLMTVCGAVWNLCGDCAKLQVTVIRLMAVETVTVLIGIHQSLLN